MDNISLHDRIVKAYKEVYGLKTKGFNKFLSKILDGPLSYRMVPDAYKYCDWCNALHVYEIENHNRIENKLDKYIELWFDADCEGVWFLLYAIDRFGNLMKIYTPEDFMQMYYEKLKKEIINETTQNSRNNV